MALYQAQRIRIQVQPSRVLACAPLRRRGCDLPRSVFTDAEEGEPYFHGAYTIRHHGVNSLKPAQQVMAIQVGQINVPSLRVRTLLPLHRWCRSKLRCMHGARTLHVRALERRSRQP